MAYKEYRRKTRTLVTEQGFGTGMRDTDAPLPAGQVKTLVNFDVKNYGTTLSPRQGYRKLYEALVQAVPNSMIYHIGRARYADVLDKDEYCTFILVGPASDTGPMHTADMVNSTSLRVIIENILDTEFVEERCDFTHRAARGEFVQSDNSAQAGAAELFRYAKPQPPVVHDTDLHDSLVPYNKTYALRGVQLNNRYYVMGNFVQGQSSVQTVFELKINKFSDAVFTTSAENIYSPSITECTEYGYNMLKENPYTLVSKRTNTSLEAGTATIDGIYTMRPGNTNPALFAYKGERLTFQACISYNGNFNTNYKWVMVDLNTGTEIVLKSTVHPTVYSLNQNSAAPSIIAQPPSDNFAIMFELWPNADGTGLERFIFTGFPVYTANARQTDELVSYNIKSSTGMCEWTSRIVYWGVDNGKNILFLSDVNNAYYVPYPGNCHTFDEPIVHCVPFMNKLLVFTETKVWQLKWNADGLSYNSILVQTNIQVPPYAVDNIHVIQNMVYFKAGNYYYMIVPRSSVNQAEALQLAPISTPITAFMDNFTERVNDIINMLLPLHDYDIFPRAADDAERRAYLIDYYSLLDNGIVRNIYKYQLVDKAKDSNAILHTLLYYDFILNYDTVSRIWSCYIVQSSKSRVAAYKHTLTSNTVFVQLATINEVSNNNHMLSFFRADNNSFKDDYTVQDNGVLVPYRIINNHQYLDTGYREQESQIKKRYREIQFKINNISNKSLTYATSFYIDDHLRKDMFKYTTVLDTDPASPTYGTLYLNKSYDDPYIIHNIAKLADEYDIIREGEALVDPTEITSLEAMDKWSLDSSSLTDVVVVKVRHSVSGKGYAPRLKLVSFNNEAFELSSISWVYRQMNAR